MALTYGSLLARTYVILGPSLCKRLEKQENGNRSHVQNSTFITEWTLRLSTRVALSNFASAFAFSYLTMDLPFASTPSSSVPVSTSVPDPRQALPALAAPSSSRWASLRSDSSLPVPPSVAFASPLLGSGGAGQRSVPSASVTTGESVVVMQGGSGMDDLCCCAAVGASKICLELASECSTSSHSKGSTIKAVVPEGIYVRVPGARRVVFRDPVGDVNYLNLHPELWRTSRPPAE